MFEASSNGSRKEGYSSQLLRVEDSLRFLEKSFQTAEDTESESIVKVIADRVAEIQQGVEEDYEPERMMPGK